MSDQPTTTRVRVEGGSFHTWSNHQLRGFNPDGAHDQRHSYKSCGFRTFLNHCQQTKETQPQ